MGARPFLSAEWRYLAMLNYEVDPSVLSGRVPGGTELDLWQGRAFVTLVGFLFLKTRVLGVPIPFHRNFEEVNLRFYVRRDVGAETRRGVTFIRELVPRLAIAAVARWAYDEPYRAVPMRHEIGAADAVTGAPTLVTYSWRHAGEWSRIVVEPGGELQPLRAGSEEEFITEHYWGYTMRSDGSTFEYRVEHPRWRLWPVRRAAVEGNPAAVYGAELGHLLSGPPASAFLAEGSPVLVRAPERISEVPRA
jgi:uncharacterized protein